MRIGFIVGKDDEIYNDETIYNKTPKKYLVNDNLNTDVAIAMTVKEHYPDMTVDIIRPREITLERLKRNRVNFILGYDCINQMMDEPYVRKFSGKKGGETLKNIYKNPDSKIFPPFHFLDFIWSKDKYMKVLEKQNVKITPTIPVSSYSTPKILQSIQLEGWKEFIIKPVGGTIALGVKRFTLSECLKSPYLIDEYFNEYKELYPKFLIQELIKGFQKYGEIKMFWIHGDYSYAVNTIDRGEDNYQVKIIKDEKILNECIKIGKKALQSLPKIKVNSNVVKPVLVRTDFTCCLRNKEKKPTNYFLNEIEHQDAGSYVNFENITYPYVQVMADTFVKKARELVDFGF